MTTMRHLQTATMALWIIGTTTFLMTIPDETTASDKFFQTGGRFGKRYDERISDIRFTDLLKTRSSPDNVQPRIERGFYISRYGKRDTSSITDSDFTLCLPSYGIYCDYTGQSNSLRCKRVHPMKCSNLNQDRTELKPENDDPIVVSNNY